MMHLEEMRYNDDFIRANRINTWEKELQMLKRRQERPLQYPNPADRIKFLEELIAKERSILNGDT